jgi:hypothetical protein
MQTPCVEYDGNLYGCAPPGVPVAFCQLVRCGENRQNEILKMNNYNQLKTEKPGLIVPVLAGQNYLFTQLFLRGVRVSFTQIKLPKGRTMNTGITIIFYPRIPSQYSLSTFVSCIIC